MLPHVSAEDPGSAQVPVADVAEVWLRFRVHTHVVGELQGAAETLAADRTLVAHAGVRQLVALQRAVLLEGLWAVGALVRPRVGVQPLVAAQRAGEGEALTAVGAGVGFLPGVDPLVLRHVHLLREALPAGGALVRTLPRVDAQVLLQRRRLEAVAAADRAAVPRLPIGRDVWVAIVFCDGDMKVDFIKDRLLCCSQVIILNLIFCEWTRLCITEIR